jgi:hypothetical protein
LTRLVSSNELEKLNGEFRRDVIVTEFIETLSNVVGGIFSDKWLNRLAISIFDLSTISSRTKLNRPIEYWSITFDWASIVLNVRFRDIILFRFDTIDSERKTIYLIS